MEKAHFLFEKSWNVPTGCLGLADLPNLIELLVAKASNNIIINNNNLFVFFVTWSTTFTIKKKSKYQGVKHFTR